MSATIYEPSGPIEVHTPRGRGVVMFVIDYGVNANLMWVCNLYDSGECWTFCNPEIRFVWNESAGTGKKPEPEGKREDEPVPAWVKQMQEAESARRQQAAQGCAWACRATARPIPRSSCTTRWKR
jgi:hypothetical protein